MGIPMKQGLELQLDVITNLSPVEFASKVEQVARGGSRVGESVAGRETGVRCFRRAGRTRRASCRLVGVTSHISFLFSHFSAILLMPVGWHYHEQRTLFLPPFPLW